MTLNALFEEIKRTAEMVTAANCLLAAAKIKTLADSGLTQTATEFENELHG